MVTAAQVGTAWFHIRQLVRVMQSHVSEVDSEFFLPCIPGTRREKCHHDEVFYDSFAYTMTDPKMWEGEWKSLHYWKRVDDQDISEVECLPDLDEHLPATTSKLNVR